jgi:hypothetical protein
MAQNKIHKLIHLDEKVLKPKDKQGTGSVAISNTSKIITEEVPQRETFGKTIIGLPKVYDLKGNLLADETNLVVLIGREYLAQLLARIPGDNPNNYTDYRVTYFGVGDGGTSNDCPPTTIGPYDDDLDLQNRVVIKDPVIEGPPNYIDGGKLKRIEYIDDQGNTQGEITVKLEEHTINTNTGGQQVVHAYTAVRYTMYIMPDETPKPNGFFKFNEAGLFAVRYENGQPTDDYILFARFTTLDKYLETNDGIMIEWYILV